MDSEWSQWVEDEDDEVPRRRRRNKRGSAAEIDVDVEEGEVAEWKKELGSKGRKPVDDRRRSRRGDDDEAF